MTASSDSVKYKPITFTLTENDPANVCDIKKTNILTETRVRNKSQTAVQRALDQIKAKREAKNQAKPLKVKVIKTATAIQKPRRQPAPQPVEAVTWRQPPKMRFKTPKD